MLMDSAVVQWWALSSHSNKVLGLNLMAIWGLSDQSMGFPPVSFYSPNTSLDAVLMRALKLNFSTVYYVCVRHVFVFTFFLID